MTEKYTKYKSPLGTMLITGDANHITGVYFEGQKNARDVYGLEKNDAAFAEITKQLTEYFAGKRKIFDIKTKFGGTPFQQKVWNELKKISFGQNFSYSDIASKAGNPKAIRAVGSAIGKNPISIIIPCHRVLAKNGGLVGFAGGLHRKEALLKLEGK